MICFFILIKAATCAGIWGDVCAMMAAAAAAAEAPFTAEKKYV